MLALVGGPAALCCPATGSDRKLVGSGSQATERKLALLGGPATQRPSNGQSQFTATNQSTTPETTTTSATQEKPKNATPTKGVARKVLHRPEPHQQDASTAALTNATAARVPPLDTPPPSH